MAINNPLAVIQWTGAMCAEIANFNPNWAHDFEQERSMLWLALPDQLTRIEHIGSTSIPNMMARTIIDIGIEVAKASQIPEIVSMLRGQGYRIDRETEAVAGVSVLLINVRKSRPSSALWVTTHDSGFVAQALRLRQWFAQHPADCQRLARLKKAWAHKVQNEPAGYDRAKAIFFTSTFEQILAFDQGH